ncbi:MAG TPA: hypothetical protein VHD36_16625 [Pirellulales bacterium]|nr:hypothetical protein [Pirellulales bacterium]
MSDQRDGDQRDSDQRDSDRRLHKSLQFGTRSVLIGTAGCALIALVFQRFGATAGVSLVWFLILAAAHVAGNAFGTRQTAQAPRPPRESPGSDPMIRYAPATPLRDQRGFGRRLVIITASAALAGLLLGSAALVLVVPANLAGIVLGSFSAAVLGGFLGFVGGSFVMVATRSFREAAAQERHSVAKSV